MSKSPWVSVADEFPPDYQVVDVWFQVWASPLSFGMADHWCEPEAWRGEGKWFHYYKQRNNEKAELESHYITHWKPAGRTDVEGPDSIIWKASALANL